MILGFKTQFVPKILVGTKIHTVRRDLCQRWQFGVKIHFATGVRTKHYEQFKSDECTGTQKVYFIKKANNFQIMIENRLLRDNEMKDFAFNDGFDSVEDLKEWFEPLLEKHCFYDGFLEAKIIHWTLFKYASL
jgi:hypothetical protein